MSRFIDASPQLRRRQPGARVPEALARCMRYQDRRNLNALRVRGVAKHNHEPFLRRSAVGHDHGRRSGVLRV